jgi:dTDP-4-dehydrorhamnose 3,5-epimerase
METELTPLKGLIIIKPKVFGDQRGFFLETYSQERYQQAGIATNFVQANHSRSKRGVLRGLHFQTAPGQPKLVYCVRGSIWDVAVDIRQGSPTFGQYFGQELSDTNHYQVYLPIGFAHGFCVSSIEADFVYWVGSTYDPETETGIAYDDPEIGVKWPLPKNELIVSDRDRQNPKLKDYPLDKVKWPS